MNQTFSDCAQSISLVGKAIPGAEDRQSRVPGFDQKKLSSAHVLCIGAGGLISHIAPTLARKGVGQITLLDNDEVDVTNLNRQHFYEEDIGQNKAIALARHLQLECIFYAVAVADFDGDGKQDLAVPAGSQLTILFGSGDGTFGRPDQYRTNDTHWILTGDLNGDGSPDLVLATDQGVSILLNKGNGEFSPAVLYGFGTDLVALADLNNDGNVDIIFTGDRIFVLLGNGDGTFQKPKAVGPPLPVLSISPGDFNHDGNIDLALGAVDSVITLLGNGDGTFIPGHEYSIKNHSATVADFNNDSNLDLAIARPYGAVTVLLGNGDGSFRESEDYYAGHDCYLIALGDFNTDGSVDMAVVDSNAGLATVLMNIGAK